MKHHLLLIGLIVALVLPAHVGQAWIINTNSEFNLQDATDRGCTTKGQCSKGMVTWSVSEPYMNLWLADAPVSYTTSLGEEISFQVFYKQRDTLPPRTNEFRPWYRSTYTLADGSAVRDGTMPEPPPPPVYVPPTGWHHNWFSYIRFAGQWYAANEHPTGYTNVMQDFADWTATLQVPGGGEIDFRSSGSFEAGDSPNNSRVTQCELLPMNGENRHIYPACTNASPAAGPNVPFGGTNVYGQIGFRLKHADGSLDLYGQVTALYGNTAIADALLTEHVDPYGNSTRFHYTNFVKEGRTIYFLSQVVDYDGLTNTLSYTTNQLLARVDTPHGRAAMFEYDAQGRLTNLVDAAGLESRVYYNSASQPYRLHTPYGDTFFEYTDDGFTNNGVRVGNAGGTNRINRSLRVTHPDNHQELFLYRFDSATLGIPATPDGPLPVSDIGSLDDNSVGNALAPLSTRNSFHWNRQQYAAVSTTNLTAMTSNDYRLATMTHWLAWSDAFLSEAPSMQQEASPDGVRDGAQIWFDAAGKAKPYLAGNFSDTLACQLMPDSSTRFTRVAVDDSGRPTMITQSYEQADGNLGTRGVSFVYDDLTATETCSVSNNQVSWVPWSYRALSTISGPEDETLFALSAPVDESVTNTITTNGVTYTYVTKRPQRRELTVTDGAYQTATAWFNARQQLTGAQLFNGVTFTNLYDANGGLTRSINLSAQTTNALSFAAGLPQRHTNALGLVTEYTWDGLQRLSTLRFPDNTGFTNVYNNMLGPVFQHDRLGHWTQYEYDGLGQLTNVLNSLGRQTRLAYCACGSPDQVTDPANASTSYTYDYNGRLLYEQDADNFTRTYHRNFIGQVTNVTDSAGHSLTIDYNHQGLVKRLSNSTGTLYQVVYDIRDRPLYVTNTYGAVIVNTYDALDRLVSRTLLNGSQTSTESYEYSANGLTSHTDPEGRVTTFGYDAAGRLCAVTNANGKAVSATFNPMGQMLTLTDGRNETTRWAYDVYGRTIAETNANGVLIRTNGYDANGRLTAQWTAAKGLATFSYDAAGNLLSLLTPNATNTYAYDALNRVTNLTDASGTITRSYTNWGAFQGALRSENGPWTDDTITLQRHANRQLNTLDLLEPGAGSRSWAFGFDGLNRLTTLNGTAGNFSFAYVNPGSRLQTVSLPGGNVISNVFDPAGQLLERWLKNSGGSTLDYFGYAHDLTGLRTNLLRADSTTVAYAYDSIGQLTSAVGREPGGGLRKNENFAYTYDPAGNLHHRTNHTLAQTFSVDDANQLANVTRDGTLTAAGTVNALAQSVTVNGVGTDLYTDDTFATTNGLTLTNGVNALTFTATDAQSHSVARTEVFNLPVTVNYTYDLNGNLVSDGARGYDYDDANRLTRITATNEWKSEFVYDALGRRIVRREYVWKDSDWWRKDEVRYVWLGMQVVQERDANNQVRVTYTGRLAREDSTQNPQQPTAYYFTDGNGNVSSLIEATGNIKARYRYDSFGNLISMSGSLATANLIRFSGKEYHPNSGLYYYGFRYYAPNLQRWMNADPIGIAGGLNLYGFVGNDPINLYDLYGLEIRSCPDANVLGLVPAPSGPHPYYFGDTVLENLYAQTANVGSLGANTVVGAVSLLNQAIEGVVGFSQWATRQLGGGPGAEDLIGRFTEAATLVAGGVEFKGLGGIAKVEGSLIRTEAYLLKGEAKAAPTLEKALVSGADDLAKAVPEPCPPVKGGTYADVRKANTGGQVHHTPASAVSPYSHQSGPTVWMETLDHRKTASWGSSKAAEAYRGRQKALIDQGKLQEAIQMDVDDIRSKFGNKYDDHIKEMLDAFGFPR